MDTTRAESDFDNFAAYVRATHGLDLRAYKRASLERRIAGRMNALRVSGYEEYIGLLRRRHEEYDELLRAALVNVTAFFRDPPFWTHLSRHVIPPLVASRPTGRIHVWSAGCATGEEAFTVAIVLAEAMGLEAYRDRVRILATDIDDRALTVARAASYHPRSVTALPVRVRDRYFAPIDGAWVCIDELRNQVDFRKHDLVADSAPRDVDLLVCRNALMYMTAATQAGILERFHEALTPGGILFLGRAETTLAHSTSFLPIDLTRRISVKASVPVHD
jgi:two-component system CheB/CheR fusion protein